MSHLKTGMYNLIKVLTYNFSVKKLYIVTSNFTLCSGVAVANKFTAPRTLFDIALAQCSGAVVLWSKSFKILQQLLKNKLMVFLVVTKFK